MPIDTRIEGNPDSVRSAAEWLRGSLGEKVAKATDDVYAARNNADAGWDGDAGEAFSARMKHGADKADELSQAAKRCADSFDAYAAELQRSQQEMETVRTNAAAAGLSVTTDLINEPGAAPPSPGSPPTGASATPEAVSSYNSAVLAAEHHAALVEAYKIAEVGADAARLIGHLALDTLKNVWNDVRQKWFFLASDLLNGAGTALAISHSSMLSEKAQRMADDSVKWLDRAKNATPGTSAATIYRDADLATELRYSSADAAAESAKVKEAAGKIGMRVGGGLAVAGIAYDIHQGKPVGQAIVSGGTGFAASVAAGAVIGSVVPVGGTIVGAAGGAVVGLFASGAVDSMYSNGVGNVGGAISDGFAAVGDTGEAVGGLAKDAWNAIF